MSVQQGEVNSISQLLADLSSGEPPFNFGVAAGAMWGFRSVLKILQLCAAKHMQPFHVMNSKVSGARIALYIGMLLCSSIETMPAKTSRRYEYQGPTAQPV